jgi:serine/threonine protein phosphatase PrpC
MAAFNGDYEDDFEPVRELATINPLATSNYKYAVAWEEMNAKRRCTMEDVHRIVPSLAGKEEYSYFGVYDGHGGRQIVDFLEERLENNISTELQLTDEAPVLERLRRAFLITDMQSRQANIMSSGATVVGALLVTRYAAEGEGEGEGDNTSSSSSSSSSSSPSASTRKITERKIYVANAGDSRAILYYRKRQGEADDNSPAGVQQRADALRYAQERQSFVTGSVASVGAGAGDSSDSSSDSDDGDGLPPFCGLTAQRLTYDHRVDDDGEQERIKKAGGFFTRNRVLGILAVTRAFGDHGMKEFVCADPFLTEVDLTQKLDPTMVILACDGVWDVLTDQEAGDIIMDEYNKIGGPFEDAGKLLVQRSIERGTADNVTAIVVFL